MSAVGNGFPVWAQFWMFRLFPRALLALQSDRTPQCSSVLVLAVSNGAQSRELHPDDRASG
jgi:hypothetical protein